LKPEIETILRRNQNGFRPGRSTAQQILVLRRLIEGVKSRKLPAVLTFIDFKKAFDSVHRGKMLKILEDYTVFQSKSYSLYGSCTRRQWPKFYLIQTENRNCSR